MQPVAGLIGPYMTLPEVHINVPSCVKLESQEDSEQLNAFVTQVIRVTKKDCHRALTTMLAKTPGAEQLALDFAKRLGL